MPECNEDGIGFTIEDEVEETDSEEGKEIIEELPDSPLVESVPDNTPELMSETKAESTDIPLSSPAGPEEIHIASLVCDVCLELNLTTKSCIECVRCGNAFCFHFASKIDAQYCVNCLSDLSVMKQVITKTYEHRDSESGKVNFYRRRAREVKIAGLDWLFAQRKIASLSDVELDMSIEYHRNICSLMLAESERRRTEYMHRNARVKVSVIGNGSVSGASVKDSTTTTVKKTRTISKNRQQEQLAALLASMKTKGVDINAIAAMLKEKK